VRDGAPDHEGGRSLKCADDIRVGLIHEAPLPLWYFIGKFSLVIHRADDRKTQPGAHLKVVFAERRSDMDDPGAVFVETKSAQTTSKKRSSRPLK